jgi:DNA-binding response OmpR family regulator
MQGADNNRLEGVSVLIAEDSWHLADAMRIMIERAGGNVVGLAGTLAEAERLSADLNYDAVLMDLNLHGKKAHGLAEKLAAAGTKVVILTGYDRPPVLATKVHDCLMKPVAIEALIAALACPPRN